MEYINRTTNKINDNVSRIFSSPVNYKKNDGTYEPIELTFEDTTSSIGDIRLNRKNIFSTGIRKDNNPEKFVGLRPDDCQDGSKQIEISINDVKIDGVSSYDINKFQLIPSSTSLFQMYENDGFKDFEIQFKIHLKNATVTNNKYTESTKIRNGLTSEFINVGQDTGTNLINRYLSDTEISSNNSYLRLYYGQVTDDFVIRFDNTNEAEFGDNDVSGFSFYDMAGFGSHMYLKNSLVFYAVGKDIGSFNQSILKNIATKYNLSLEDSNGETGRYFYKDNKKVGSYIMYDNKVLGHLNTEEINQDIKSKFIRKTFNSTSFLDLTLSNFETDIRDALSYTANSIEVDTNYYQGNEFVLDCGDSFCVIELPVIFDENYNQLSNENDCTHTLKDNGDGTYLYTKYLSIEGMLKSLGVSKNFIDVNITLNYFTGGGTGIADHNPGYAVTSAGQTSQTKLNIIRNATTGTGLLQSFSNQTIVANKSRTSTSSGSTQNYSYYQYHINFDTSGVSSATDVKLHMYSKFSGVLTNGLNPSYGDYDGIRMKLIKSTYVADSTGDGSTNQIDDVNESYNDFTGFTSSWAPSDTTPYIDSTIDLASSATSFAWKITSLNSTAVSDVNSSSVTKMCLMENDENYTGNFDSDFTYHTTSEATGTGTVTKRLETPKLISSTFNNTLDSSYYTFLEVTEATVSTPTDNATFFGANF